MAVLASFSLPAALSTLTGNRFPLSRPARLTSSRQFPHRRIVLRLQSRDRSFVGSVFTDEEQEAVVPASVPVRVAHELLQAGHRYLDVRTVDEFNAGHVVGATNIPFMLKAGSVKVALRRLRRMDFQFIIDKVLKRLNTWGTKFIFLAGKIILVKSVLLSFPSFYSTHFFIPICTLNEIDKLCRTFIWRKMNGGLGHHYMSWNNMCRPLEDGGRWLHSCTSKMGSLRAKLAWKYIQEKDYMLHKCLHPKYGKIWNQNAGRKSCSPAWKLIKSGGNCLKKIVRWKIANGESIDILNDVWIMDKSLNMWPTFVGSLDGIDGTVNDLQVEGNWNIAVLKKYFGDKLIERICKVQIFSNQQEDEPELIQGGSGKTVSALICSAGKQNCEDYKFWTCLKKAKLNARVETFWWRLLNNAIQTFSFLSYRRLQQNNCCPRESNEVEYSNHLIVSCKKLNDIILLLNQWGFNIPVATRFED